MIFDQYSRYKACADLLRQVGLTNGNSVLDIGSGPECLFGQFMPDSEISYVDPLINVGSGPRRIVGDLFSDELDGRNFDCVSAIDVLEHIPPKRRQAFFMRMSSMAKSTMILGFPTIDSSDASLVDEAIKSKFFGIFGREYCWLEEHNRYGLPSLADTVGDLEKLGWHCQTIGHGHAPWLMELLSFVICVWDVPSMRTFVKEISAEFNRKLYSNDFRPPFYRQFVVASREPLPELIRPTGSTDYKADHAFASLMESAWQRYFELSLKTIAAKDAQISAMNQKAQELSDWGIGLQASVEVKDAQISEMNQKAQELSDWGIGLQASVEVKDAQISAMNQKAQELSDWGIGLQASVEVKDAQISAMNQKAQELSDWGAGLQASVAERDEQIAVREQVLSAKQAELMKMSDWAYGMMQELERRNASVGAQCRSLAKRLVLFARKQLAQTLVGDLARNLRDRRRYRERQVSIEALRQSLKDNHGRLIIVFPVITWDFRWQRPQHIVSRLRDHGYSVLYMAMTLTAQGRRLRGDKDAIAEARFNELDRHINQIWLSTSKHLNIYTDPLDGDDLHNISAGLSALVSELRPKSIKYLIQFPGWWPVVKKVKEQLGGSVIFDCMDDHSGFSTNTKQALITEDELLKTADLVITSSDLLEKKAKQINPHVIQIKNGTELVHFAYPSRNGELDHLSGRPIIGYYGAISDWFDMEIVAHCARKFPDWIFVLIGATFGADMQPVEGLKNVLFLGEKPYKDLPGYLAYFDVCTIPFKIIPLTLATNPVKFYEYLSAGKPVVAVELPELIAYQEDCYLARNADEFAALLERAYGERDDEKKVERRIKLASENSWDSRVRDILESSKF
jgi:glycosyltransferase involved in cell wall biosynthesis